LCCTSRCRQRQKSQSNHPSYQQVFFFFEFLLIHFLCLYVEESIRFLNSSSGGGSYTASDIIAREIRKAKEAGKKVVVSMSGYAASGGYYISADADRIVAEPTTITGTNSHFLISNLFVSFFIVECFSTM
jgi:hypothetical protein